MLKHRIHQNFIARTACVKELCCYVDVEKTFTSNQEDLSVELRREEIGDEKLLKRI